ncbi:diguanylate cyclase [Pseudothermotoga sp.]|uniref:diguanylate cyclase domain-containing protein n=1 Tax=Pseudothermotoga sp. TaxID=2033661 RepID=UPI0031F6D44D
MANKAERKKLIDFVQKQVFHGAILISVIFCALIFPVLFFYLLKVFQQEELALAMKLERDWSNTVEYFGKLLNVVSIQTDSFEDQETILSLLKQIYKDLSPLVSYPAFGRTDGKMFSYPPRDYGPTYDPRERPWYKAAVEKPEQYVVVKPFIHAILNEPVIAVAKAVLDEDGKVIGVIGLDLVGSRLAEGLLIESSYIMDESGQIVAKRGSIKGTFKPELSSGKNIVSHLNGLIGYIAIASIGGTYVVLEYHATRQIVIALLISLGVFGSLFTANALALRNVHKKMKENVIEPLQRIALALKEYEIGKDRTFGKIETEVDELNLLAERFSEMVGTMNSQFEKLQMSYSKESNLRKAQQALLNITERYLQGTKIEQMYQFLLEKAIEAIPKAQGGSVLLRKDDRYIFVATVGYDLKELSKVSFPAIDVTSWVGGKASIRKKNDVISYERHLDEESIDTLRKVGRLDEVKCSLNFIVEVEGKTVILFNIDNFEDEDAFDQEALELARLFASYLGILFTKAELEEKIEEQQRMMEYLSSHDPLTGLANRRAFEEFGEKILSLARRQNKKVAVMFLDLSKFKQVNDVFGHNFGDEVLKVIGSRLERNVRQVDLLARFGGDEFVLLVYDCDEECTKNLAERLIKLIEEPIDLGDGRQIKISANMGVAFYPKDGEELDQLVRAADIAMYHAKRNNALLAFFKVGISDSR